MSGFEARWEFDTLIGEPVDGITSIRPPGNWSGQPILQLKDDHSVVHCSLCGDRTGASPIILGSADGWTSLASRPPIPDEVLDEWVRNGNSGFQEWRQSPDTLRYVRVKYLGLTEDGEVA